MPHSETLPAVDALPITFAEGIACVYSRPGRALRGWLRWARHDFVESKAVQLLREGLLARPDFAAEIGYARLASTLRRLPIGFKLERYLPKIEEAIAHAQQSQAEYLERRDPESPELPAEEPDHDFGLPALKTLQAMVQPLVQLAPQTDDTAAVVLEKARQFLLQCARADNKLDRYARGKLLDDISSMLSTLELAVDTPIWTCGNGLKSCHWKAGSWQVDPSRAACTWRRSLKVVTAAAGSFSWWDWMTVAIRSERRSTRFCWTPSEIAYRIACRRLRSQRNISSRHFIALCSACWMTPMRKSIFLTLRETWQMIGRCFPVPRCWKSTALRRVMKMRTWMI